MNEYIDEPSAEIGFEFEDAEERATVLTSFRTRRKWDREWLWCSLCSLCSFVEDDVGGEELYGVVDVYGACGGGYAKISVTVAVAAPTRVTVELLKEPFRSEL